MKLSTKAETLLILQQHSKGFSVLPQVCLTVRELECISAGTLNEMVRELTAPFIVRSSALSEDTGKESNAGAYLSVQDVAEDELPDACRRVAASYKDNNPDNQILIQPMIYDIAISGVIFTIDPNTGGNYYVINYDDSGANDSVTGGKGGNFKTYYLFRGKRCKDEMINRLASVADEILELFDSEAIDIEFVVSKKEKGIFVLQARPLVLRVAVSDCGRQKEILDSAVDYLAREFRPQIYVSGKSTIYSVMADWNPAEMIGVRPKPLALSLYKRLITDGVWAFQRDNYGYRNLRSFPLLRCICGTPYIDTRVSFNSFIPKGIDEGLTEKLVDYYLSRLAEKPENHDKVEFEIIFSCYTFDLPERIKVLLEYGFTDKEIQIITDALRDLTNNIIAPQKGLWVTDAMKIEELKRRQIKVLDSDSDDLTKIYWLLEDCERYGTLPFAGLARAGFIAVQLLKSLVSAGVLTENDYYDFMSEQNTVGSQMVADRNELSEWAFLKKYGHLRPGTYDIISPRYDSEPETYFGNKEEKSTEKKSKPLSLTINQYQSIQNLMVSNGMTGDVLDLFQFIKSGIEGREWAKFVFTKSVSEVLELIAGLCKRYGISREDASYLNIDVIDSLYSLSGEVKTQLIHSIEEGKQRYADTLQNVLPPIIQSETDVFSFAVPNVIPSYITQKSVQGVVVCECDIMNGAELKNRILLIPAADPGYDWIFSHQIGGFITAYGGVNSHMAIRAGELCIPAVLGVGETGFNRYKNANMLRLDCANKRIEIIC